MNGPPGRILVATDGSEDATLAVRAAADLSGRAGADLYLVHVRQPLPAKVGLPHSAYFDRTVDDYAARRDEETEQLMRQQSFKAKAEGAEVTGTYPREGRAAEEITGLAEELGADLLVVGRRGLGPIKRLVMGSVSERVVDLAPCPTLIVRGGEGAWPPSRLIVGDDGSEEAGRAGRVAAGIGRLLGLHALLIRVYPSVPVFKARRVVHVRFSRGVLKRGGAALRRRAAGLQSILGTRPAIRVASGDVVAVIRDAAREGGEPALVAVGRRGPGAVRRLAQGSVSAGVLRTVGGPVLVVPPSSPHREHDHRFA